jgi:hypothetical protein
MEFARADRGITLIESLKKMLSALHRANFSVDNVHSEVDSVKSASPKSGFPDVDEGIRIFSWNATLLRRWNHNEIFESAVKRFF